MSVTPLALGVEGMLACVGGVLVVGGAEGGVPLPGVSKLSTGNSSEPGTSNVAGRSVVRKSPSLSGAGRPFL